jgi:hypothetical protein
MPNGIAHVPIHEKMEKMNWQAEAGAKKEAATTWAAPRI